MPFRPLTAVALLAVAIGASACGGAHEAQIAGSLDEMRHDLKHLREAYEAQGQRLESVQDRLALVEDQLEGRALHGAAVRGGASTSSAGPLPKSLPVVRLRPAAPAPTPAPRPAAPVREPVITPGEPPPATITQADIDAMDGPAPVRRTRRGPRRAVPPPANAARAGNIGVAKVAPRPDFAGGAGGAAEAKAPDDPIGAYKFAQARYRAGDLAGAQTAADTFVRTWPSHGYADNALFLTGRCNYDRGRYADALSTFRRVLEVYPTGNQVPDALLMIGLTQTKMGRAAEGRETLSRLRAMYPDTAAARQAESALGRAGQM